MELTPMAACTLQSVYKWRIDLSKSEKYWDGWFRGTSNLFLACNLPKLLLLAGRFFTNNCAQLLWWEIKSEFCALLPLRVKGIDRLDRDLTIGQMQGDISITP